MKFLSLSLLSLFFFLSVAHGQNAEALRERMSARLSEIGDMKTARLVGENNQAYLTVLGDLNEHQSTVVQQENADRRTVYTMLARQTGATLEIVLKRRAEQLREQALPGTMIQLENGEWVEKR